MASKEQHKQRINEYLEKREIEKQNQHQKQKADELVGSSMLLSRYPNLEKEESTYSSDRYVSSLESDLTKNTANWDEAHKGDTFNLFDSLNFSKDRRDSSPSTVFSSSERNTLKNDLSNPYIQREEGISLREGHGNELEVIFF